MEKKSCETLNELGTYLLKEEKNMVKFKLSPPKEPAIKVKNMKHDFPLNAIC